MSTENKRASAEFEALMCRLNGLELRSICCRIVSVGKSGDDVTPVKVIYPDSSDSGCESRNGERIPTFELSAEYFAKCSDNETEGALIGSWKMYRRMAAEPERVAAAKKAGKKFEPIYGSSVRRGLPRGPGKSKSTARKDCRAEGVKLGGDRDIGLRWTKPASDDTKATMKGLRSWWDVSLGLKKDGTPVSTKERDAENAKRRERRAERQAEAAEQAERGEVNMTILMHEDQSDWLLALIEQNDGDSVKVMKMIQAAADMPVAEETADEKAA